MFMSLAAVAAVFAGCQKPELEVAPVEVKDAFTASVENFDATKTALDGNHVVWSADDQLAIFQGFGVADLYEIADASAGSSSAKFVYKTSGLGDDFYGGVEMNDPRNVAFYPYAEGLASYSEDGAWVVTNVTLPATQVYTENSFANGAFPMVAVTESLEDHVLRFKNVLGAVKLQLKGSAVVKSVALKGNNDEVLAGAATVTAHDGYDTPSVVMAEDGATEVVLDCGEGVEVSKEGTNFVLALPPVVFEKGFTVTVTFADGKTHTVEATTANSVLRSGILVMPAVTLPSVTVTTVSSMADAELNVALEGYTGFYGLFVRPEMWQMIVEYVENEWVAFSDILGGMLVNEGPCFLYQTTSYTGNISTFGFDPVYYTDPEYAEYAQYMRNMIQPNSEYCVVITPTVAGKDEYTIADAQVFTVQTNAFKYGGNVALPNYVVEEGYNTTMVTFEPSADIAYAMYEIFPADAELPTAENYLDMITYDGYYDSEFGFEVMVDNDYGVLPGVEYKLCVMLANAAGETQMHVLDVKTLTIPYNEDLVITFEGAPEFDPANNTALTIVNVPAGAVKLYYTLNKQATYTDYNAANALVGILDGTTSFNFVDLTEEGVVEDGQVVLEPSVGSLNNYGDAKVAVHVAVVDTEGKVSHFTSSETCTATKKQQ